MNTLYGNYAQLANADTDDIVRCYWMDRHIDDHYLDDNGCYTINILYADPDATLLHRVDGKWVCTRLKNGDTVTFKACHYHGLYPYNIAVAYASGVLPEQVMDSVDSILFNAYSKDYVLEFKFIHE